MSNVLRTITTKAANQSLNIHLNHSCPLVLARNVLILKIISSSDFSIDSKEDMDYVWDLWYNFQWPKSTLLRFREDVQSLIKQGLPEYCSSLKDRQLEDVLDVLNGWMTILTQKLTNPMEMKSMLKER